MVQKHAEYIPDIKVKEKNSDNLDSSPDRDTKKERDALRIKDYEQDIVLRKRFAWATFFLLVGWLGFVAAVVFFMNSSESAVKITLITTATVKVIGLYIIVLKYLFNPSPREY